MSFWFGLYLVIGIALSGHELWREREYAVHCSPLAIFIASIVIILLWPVLVIGRTFNTKKKGQSREQN